MSAGDQIRTTVEELLKALAIKNVIGQPIEIEDKTLIPVARMGLGFGSGTGEGKGEKGEGGKGGGTGGGAGVDPVAMIVVFKGVQGPEGIKVFPLGGPNPIAKALEEIAPAVAEKIGQKQRADKVGK